jgi:hypothetical protein
MCPNQHFFPAICERGTCNFKNIHVEFKIKTSCWTCNDLSCNLLGLTMGLGLINKKCYPSIHTSKWRGRNPNWNTSNLIAKFGHQPNDLGLYMATIGWNLQFESKGMFAYQSFIYMFLFVPFFAMLKEGHNDAHIICTYGLVPCGQYTKKAKKPIRANSLVLRSHLHVATMELISIKAMPMSKVLPSCFQQFQFFFWFF